jgi:hypothetical protein
VLGEKILHIAPKKVHKEPCFIITLGYMLLINISSDKVYLSDGQREKLLDRNGIEDTLGPVLIDWQRTSPFQQIFLINGPG